MLYTSWTPHHNSYCYTTYVYTDCLFFQPVMQHLVLKCLKWQNVDVYTFQQQQPSTHRQTHSSLRTVGVSKWCVQSNFDDICNVSVAIPEFIVNSCERGYSEDIWFSILLSRETLDLGFSLFCDLQPGSNHQSVPDKVALLRLRLGFLIISNDTLVCR